MQSSLIPKLPNRLMRESRVTRRAAGDFVHRKKSDNNNVFNLIDNSQRFSMIDFHCLQTSMQISNKNTEGRYPNISYIMSSVGRLLLSSFVREGLTTLCLLSLVHFRLLFIFFDYIRDCSWNCLFQYARYSVIIFFI